MRTERFRSSSRAKVRVLAPWAAVIAPAGKGRWVAFESRAQYLESDLGPVPSEGTGRSRETMRRDEEKWRA